MQEFTSAQQNCILLMIANLDPMRWVSRLLSNNNEYEEPCIPRVRIGDTVTFEELCHWRRRSIENFGQFFWFTWSKNGISIADIQTKVVKIVIISPIRMSGQTLWLLGIILITPYLLTLSIWIQITIHPLATAGAIVI